MTAPYHGLFRGTVVNNVDPMMQGRIQVMVPDVSNVMLSSWANPCFPTGGLNMGLFSVPLPGSGVYVAFEQGDPDYPVWLGVFTGSPADKPGLANTALPPTPAIVLGTPLNNAVVISDALGPAGLGGVVLMSATGAMIAVNSLGITISNGQGAVISLIGPKVDINFGALSVI